MSRNMKYILEKRPGEDSDRKYRTTNKRKEIEEPIEIAQYTNGIIPPLRYQYACNS